MELFEKRLDGERLFEGRVFCVDVDSVELENGKIARREVVRHAGGVCVAAVDDEGFVYLVRQFRYPYARVVTELPAGKLERGEDPDVAAARELAEETGFAAGSIRRVAQSYPSPGFSDEILYLYLATDLTHVGQKLDEDEFLKCERVPLSDAVARVLSGEILDGKTQTLLLLVERILS